MMCVHACTAKRHLTFIMSVSVGCCFTWSSSCMQGAARTMMMRRSVACGSTPARQRRRESLLCMHGGGGGGQHPGRMPCSYATTKWGAPRSAACVHAWPQSSGPAYFARIRRHHAPPSPMRRCSGCYVTRSGLPTSFTLRRCSWRSRTTCTFWVSAAAAESCSWSLFAACEVPEHTMAESLFGNLHAARPERLPYASQATAPRLHVPLKSAHQ